MNVMLVSVYIDRDAKLPESGRDDDSLLRQLADESRYFDVAKRDRDDRALVALRQVRGNAFPVRQGSPECGRELVIAGVYRVGPEVVEERERGLIANCGKPTDRAVET